MNAIAQAALLTLYLECKALERKDPDALGCLYGTWEDAWVTCPETDDGENQSAWELAMRRNVQ